MGIWANWTDNKLGQSVRQIELEGRTLAFREEVV